VMSRPIGRDIIFVVGCRSGWVNLEPAFSIHTCSPGLNDGES